MRVQLPFARLKASVTAMMVCAPLVLSACENGSDGNTNSVPDESDSMVLDDVNTNEPLANDLSTSDLSTTDLPANNPTQPLDSIDSTTTETMTTADNQVEPVLAPTETNESPESTQLPVGDNSETLAIAGTWDFTRQTQSGLDVLYASISESGDIIEYDYQQDAVGNQQDCFLIRTAGIASRGANQYDIQDTSALPGSTGSEDVLITVANGEILFRYFGIENSPEQGDVLDPRSEMFPASQRDFSNVTVCKV